VFRIESDFDPRKFESGLKRQMNDGLQAYAARLQLGLDDLHSRLCGHPIDQVKPELQSTWRAATQGGEINDPHLTAFAEAIAEGRRVVLDTSEFRV